MTNLRLGRNPRDHRKPLLDVAAHLTAQAYAAPASVDYGSQVKAWTMGANDSFGTCGPTSVANAVTLLTTILEGTGFTPTLDDIFDLYRRSGNPGFNPDLAYDDPRQEDNGVDMQTMLNELVKGGIGVGERNIKALAFGGINPDDRGSMRAAAAVFGFVLLGVSVQAAQMDQFDAGKPWNYVRGSRNEGGHAILAGESYFDASGTAKDTYSAVTWAKEIVTTEAFDAHLVEECYVVIFPQHVGTKSFQAGVDLTTLADEYRALTGQELPVAPVEPSPVPVSPSPDVDTVLEGVVDAYNALGAQLASLIEVAG